jgi:WD repeat-containing protein 48
LDVQVLEETMPMWLMDYLLINKVPTWSGAASSLSAGAQKISFVLMPWNRDPDIEPLPELLNTCVFFSFGFEKSVWLTDDVGCRQQSKLTASRTLRVRKIAIHVCLFPLFFTWSVFINLTFCGDIRCTRN